MVDCRGDDAAYPETDETVDVLESILQSMSDGLAVVDQRGNFIRFNAAAERILQIMPSEEVGPGDWSTHFGLFLPDRETPFPTDHLPLVRAMAGETVRDVEIFVRNQKAPDGHWLSVNARPLRHRDGQVYGGVAVFRDVTERVRAQRALARRTIELARSNAELEQFAAVASHDLQEPLRNITSYTDMLRRRLDLPPDEDAGRYLDSVTAAAERMRTLIEDLLDLARVGSGERVRTEVDCNALLDRVLHDLQPRIAETGARVETGRMPTLTGDPSQLARVFQNLLSNALKFHGERPPVIRISSQRRHREFLFAVADEGIGMEPDQGDLIFGAFKRLHGRTSYPGTGIGLAICKKIIERHGGRIWVESRPGAGSTFFFTLPTRDRRA